MKNNFPFSRQDLLLIKWRFLLAIISLLLAAGIYFYAQNFRNELNTGLINAQRDFRNAQQQLDQIEQEEATIIQYIDRYQELDDAGIVQAEDRLQFLEMMTDIRTSNNLFPIALNIQSQQSIALRYGPEVRDPGGPVNLNVSRVELSLPLLHEGDLVRLLDDMIAEPGLQQAVVCNIRLNNITQGPILNLGQHQNASCEFNWYTFNLTPPG